MGFVLPPVGHPVRDHFEMTDLAVILDPRNVHRLQTYRGAIQSAKADMNRTDGMIRSMTIVCLRANDERWLIEVGPRGGVRKLWNFGTGR